MATPSSDTETNLRVRQQDLAGKVAIVTGASRGIGRAIALNLATRGCSLLATCSSRETVHRIDTLARAVGAHYTQHHSKFLTPKIVGVAADMLSRDCANTIADALGRSFKGRVDIVVNSAAVTGPSALGELDDAHVARFTLGNVHTPALLVDELVKRRQFRPGSRIVLVSSARARRPGAKGLMYAATKAAGEAMTRCWADAFGGKEPAFAFMAGTTANAVVVGLTKTDAVERHGDEEVERITSQFLPSMALPHVAEAEDVADVVGLLCSQDSRFITGSVVSADGGGIKIC